jgi:hypothetical protein
MAGRELHLERLLNRRVVDSAGHTVGRLEEAIARNAGRHCEVVEYHVGAYALLDRLGAWYIGRSILRCVGLGKGYRVRWDQLELSEDGDLRLTCAVTELQTLAW